MSVLVVLWCVAALLGTAVVAVVVARMPRAGYLVYGASAAASAIAFLVALGHLLGNPDAAPAVTLPLGIPWIGAHFRLDALAAFFLVVVNLGGTVASVYGLGYGRHEAVPARVLPFFAAFLAGMNLVVLADDAFSYLLSWEFMSLASWALVMAHHREAGNARAGYVYLVMASFGTLALLLAFGLLAGTDGGYGFAAIRGSAHAPLVVALVLALVLLGAGSKAGIVPLHVWLPLAHPAAPSHVSALMSGVMTKVAIYAFVRIMFDLLGGATWWSGMTVLFLGGITAVLGVLYALMQHDLKRLLAYHTVENIGIIYIGLGLALAFKAYGMGLASALALTAALFHVLNHSLFKSLLFFGAGAVLTATGERDMEHLGGLVHRMPATSFFFLVGCAAISALPPLNGFVSEWLTFQAILQSPELPQWGLKLLVPAVGGLLALVRGARRRLFRQGLRRDFPRPSAHGGGGGGAGSGPSVARRHARSLVPVPARRYPARLRDRRTRARDARAGRRTHDGAGRHSVAVDRAHCRGTQFLQRFPRVPVHRALCVPGRPCRPPLCVPRTASRAGLGLWIPRPESDDAIYRGKLRATDPARIRHHGLPRPRNGGHAAAGRAPARILRRRSARPGLGLALRSDRGCGRLCCDPAQPPAVPDDPAISESRPPRADSPAPGACDMAVMTDLLVQSVQMTLVLLLAPLLTGFVRKLKARLLRRRGPSVIQPYRDLLRLLRKEVVLADGASWLFRVAPYLIFAFTWVAVALVPTFATGLLFSWTADLIAIIALLGSARFFLALAGMDVGTSFGGLGSSREVMIASLAEPAMLLIVFSLALVAGSTQLSTVAAFMGSPAVGLRVSLGMALVALIMVAIAENGRIPIDNPATHLELTMVHEAMVLEYSGRHLAMIEFAASLKLLLYVSLIASVFMPWGLAAAGSGPAAYAIGGAAWLCKLAVAGVLLALFETVIAKMRVFRVPEFLGAALMLGLLGTLLLFVSRSL